MPRTIASPRPAPPSVPGCGRRCRARPCRTRAPGRLPGCRRSRRRPPAARRRGSGAATTCTLPSAGVWRMALTSRLVSTRDISRGSARIRAGRRPARQPHAAGPRECLRAGEGVVDQVFERRSGRGTGAGFPPAMQESSNRSSTIAGEPGDLGADLPVVAGRVARLCRPPAPRPSRAARPGACAGRARPRPRARGGTAPARAPARATPSASRWSRPSSRDSAASSAVIGPAGDRYPPSWSPSERAAWRSARLLASQLPSEQAAEPGRRPRRPPRTPSPRRPGRAGRGTSPRPCRACPPPRRAPPRPR